MNSAAYLKAFCGRHGGLICTSSNAGRAFDWAFARSDRVFFFPDQHLGRNTGLALGIHPAVVALAGLASIEPRLLLLGAGVWGVVAAIRRRARPVAADDEATYFRALSAELRAEFPELADDPPAA